MPFDLESFLGELETWADEARWPVETLRYGPHADQVADLRRPGAAGERPRPLAIVLHGGFWRARFTRAITAALAVDLARRGWTTLNAEYRRVGAGGGVPSTLDDVAAAVGAGLERVRPPCAVVLGHSAGGHLALWAGAELAGLDAVVSLAGVADLTGAAREGLGDGAAVDLAGGTPEERPEAYALADPLRRPPPARALLVHGELDEVVPVEQSRRYATAHAERCELLELPGTGHFEPIDPRSGAWAATVARLEELLARSPSGRRQSEK